MQSLRKNEMIGDDFEIKPEFWTLAEMKLNVWNDFPNFYLDEKWVRIEMRRFYDEFVCLEESFQITKNVMNIVTGLNDSGALLTPKAIKNKDVEKLTKATFDGHSMSINIVENVVIQYASLMIGNKIYFTNRDNSISATIVNMAYEMVERNVDYDFCELLKMQFLENLK